MLVGMRVQCDVDDRRGVPCLTNDHRVLDPAVAAVRVRFGHDRITRFEATPGGDDFALRAERVPSFQLKIGSGQSGRLDKPRNSAYQPDKACIGCGVQALSRTALELLAG